MKGNENTYWNIFTNLSSSVEGMIFPAKAFCSECNMFDSVKFIQGMISFLTEALYAEHDTQLSAEVAPILVEYFPASHCWHIVDPVKLHIYPATHSNPFPQS